MKICKYRNSCLNCIDCDLTGKDINACKILQSFTNDLLKQDQESLFHIPENSLFSDKLETYRDNQEQINNDLDQIINNKNKAGEK